VERYTSTPQYDVIMIWCLVKQRDKLPLPLFLFIFLLSLYRLKDLKGSRGHKFFPNFLFAYWGDIFRENSSFVF
jgi:hypothetical protein